MADDLADLLRSRGLRVTQGRLAVLRAIGAADRPLSHDEILRRLRRIASRATVFRILDDLVRTGLARRLDVGDRRWRFARATPALVAVFACSACPTILNVEVLLTTLPPDVPRALRASRVEVLLRGLCDACI